MFIFVKRGAQYAGGHVIMSNAIHAVGGFGLAVLLQYYLAGSAFVPAWAGWVSVACSIAGHLWLMARHTR